jgi:hypothetical protein
LNGIVSGVVGLRIGSLRRRDKGFVLRGISLVGILAGAAIAAAEIDILQ